MFDVLIYKSIIFLRWSHKSQCLQNKAKKSIGIWIYLQFVKLWYKNNQTQFYFITPFSIVVAFSSGSI
jgi:hypothetical protein